MQELHRRPVAAAGRGGAVSSGARGGTATRGYHRAGMADAPVHTNRLADETSPYLLQHAHNPVDWWPWGPTPSPERSSRPPRLPEHRLRGVPLVPRDGAGELRGRADRGLPERELHRDQGRPRGAPRPRSDLHDCGPGADRAGRLADEPVPHAAGTPVLRRDVLPRRAAPRHAQLPPGPRGCRAGVAPGPPGRRAGGRPGRRGAAAGHDAGGRSRGRPAGRRHARHRHARDRAAVRCPERRLGPRAEVPAADDDRVPAAPSRRDGRERPLAIARRSLDAMQDGGIHDQLGGGFHRYSTTADWLVPHFEQMLYDNGQWRVSTSMHGSSRAIPRIARPPRVSSTTCCASSRPPMAASPRARTPTPRGRRAARSSGRPPRSLRSPDVADDVAPLFAAAYGVTDAGNWEGRRSCRASRTTRHSRSGSDCSPRRSRDAWLWRGTCSSLAVPRGPNPLATTRCSRAGTAWRSPRSRMPSGHLR